MLRKKTNMFIHRFFWLEFPRQVLTMEGKVEFSCEGLAQDWDSVESIRERLRAGKDLCENETTRGKDSTIAECAANYDVLVPALTRLFASAGKLPDINSLKEQVSNLFALCHKMGGEDTIDDAAWLVRKMLRFVKRKCQRKDVSLVAWLKQFSRRILQWLILEDRVKMVWRFLCLIRQVTSFQELVCILDPDLEARLVWTCFSHMFRDLFAPQIRTFCIKWFLLGCGQWIESAAESWTCCDRGLCFFRYDYFDLL